MARKKSSRRKSAAPDVVQDLTAVQPRRTEKALRVITEVLEQHDFESLDEANAYLQQLVESGELNKMMDAPPATPLDEAYELVEEALEARGSRRRRLARKALSISPDCVDAYMVLAEMAPDVGEARALYEQAIEAAERVLGPELFAEYSGNLWGTLDGRPYMRARFGLAHLLWVIGERQQAIDHAQELLRLNVHDNQGIRYELIDWLIAQGADDAAQQLMKQYKEDVSASWAYSRALLAYRRKPNSRAARMARTKAIYANPFVPAYLLSWIPVTEEMPEFMEFGAESEAFVYVDSAFDNWHDEPGALEWLAEEAGALYSNVLDPIFQMKK